MNDKEKEFLQKFLELLDEYNFDFFSCSCCSALSFKNGNDYFIEDLSNKADLRKNLKFNGLTRQYFVNNYYQIYGKYCELHPEEITSDFILEEDGKEEYIEEIIEMLKEGKK